jgi:hypothetical protein
MRYGLLVVLGVPACIAIHQIWISSATEAALSEEARLATEIRCEGRVGEEASKCRKLHERLYLAGTLDPEKALRDHCTRDTTVEWGRRPPAPPELCVERYGGWKG